MLTTERRKLTEPLGSVTEISGGLVVAFMLIGIVFALSGSGSFWGFGHASFERRPARRLTNEATVRL